MREQSNDAEDDESQESEQADLKKFCEDIAALCREFDINPYPPHLKTDPIMYPDLSPSEVYEMNRKEVLGSDVVIAYVGIPYIWRRDGDRNC